MQGDKKEAEKEEKIFYLCYSCFSEIAERNKIHITLWNTLRLDGTRNRCVNCGLVGLYVRRFTIPEK